MRELERRVLLSVIDRHWREHLYEMDYLQEGIGLRAMGQRDPLVEYQREGFDMFNAMMEAIKEEAVGFLFNVEVQTRDGRAVDRRSPTSWPPDPARTRARSWSSTWRRRARPPPTRLPADAGRRTPSTATPGEPAQALPTEPVGVAGLARAVRRADGHRRGVVAGRRDACAADAGGRSRCRSAAGGGRPGAPVPAAPVPAAPVPAPEAPAAALPEAFGRPDRPQALAYSGPAFDAAPGSTGVTTSGGPGGTGVRTGGAQNRNELCACGSGRKYKRCHGDPRSS